MTLVASYRVSKGHGKGKQVSHHPTQTHGEQQQQQRQQQQPTLVPTTTTTKLSFDQQQPIPSKLKAGFVDSFVFRSGDELSNETIEELLRLTKNNMKDLYDQANWGWDDVTKRKELCNDSMYFFIARSSRAHSTPPCRGHSTPNHATKARTSSSEKRKCVIRFSRRDSESTKGSCGSPSASSNPDTASPTPKTEIVCRDVVGCSGTPPASEGNISDIVGFAAFCLSVDHGIELVYIRELQLAERVRGQGLGSLFMSHIEQLATRANKRISMLTVFTKNQAAMRFYEKIGYQIDEASPGVCYNIDTSAYEIMSKTLDPKLNRFECTTAGCTRRFRFPDSLRQHRSLVHGEPWPFPCSNPGCNLGVVLESQLSKHKSMHCKKPNAPEQQPGAPPQNDAFTLGSTAETSKTNTRTSEKLKFQRVVVKKTGTNGTIIKAVGSGFYMVRLDGESIKVARFRRTDFSMAPGSNVEEYVPRKRKVIDPDWEYAMQLQRQESRKSVRSVKAQ